MPIQNQHEIEQLTEAARKLEEAARQAKNNADIEEIHKLQQQLTEVQEQIQEARGKAINGSGTSTEPLFDAQLRVENAQRQMDEVAVNLEALDDTVQP